MHISVHERLFWSSQTWLNLLRLSQLAVGHIHCASSKIEPETNGRHFPDDIFKFIFLNENVLISIKISLKLVPKGQINNIPALV